VFLLLVLTGTFVAQDFIKENPAFEKLYNKLSAQNRDQMLKYLLSLTPENRPPESGGVGHQEMARRGGSKAANLRNCWFGTTPRVIALRSRCPPDSGGYCIHAVASSSQSSTLNPLPLLS
jgi:hypothetical protein